MDAGIFLACNDLRVSIGDNAMNLAQSSTLLTNFEIMPFVGLS